MSKRKWFTFTWDWYIVYMIIDIYTHNNDIDQKGKPLWND